MNNAAYSKISIGFGPNACQNFILDDADAFGTTISMLEDYLRHPRFRSFRDMAQFDVFAAGTTNAWAPSFTVAQATQIIEALHLALADFSGIVNAMSKQSVRKFTADPMDAKAVLHILTGLYFILTNFIKSGTKNRIVFRNIRGVSA